MPELPHTPARRAPRRTTHPVPASGDTHGGTPRARSAGLLVALAAACLMIMLPLHGSAQSNGGQFGSWSEREAMGTARYGASAVFLGEDIYVFGGVKDTGGLRSMERYDLTSGTQGHWSYEASLFAPRMDMAAVAYNWKIWVFGGLHMPDGDMRDNSASNRVYSYNPDTNSWSGNHASLPVAVAGATAQVANGKAYVMGGYECPRNGDWICEPEVTDLVQVYDFATDTWSPGSPLPTGVALASSHVYANRPEITVSGGATQLRLTYAPGPSAFESYEGYQFRNDLQSYNATTDSWTTCCGTPDNAARWVYARLPGLWIAGAGTSVDSGGHRGSLTYHAGPPNSDWMDIEDPRIQTVGPAFAKVGHELHVVGGYDIGNTIFRSEHFVYEAPEPTQDSTTSSSTSSTTTSSSTSSTSTTTTSSTTTQHGVQGHAGTPDSSDSDGSTTPPVRDTDGDGVPDSQDVCPGAPDHADQDRDGVPDACDPTPDGSGSTDIPVLHVAVVGLVLLVLVQVRRRW